MSPASLHPSRTLWSLVLGLLLTSLGPRLAAQAFVHPGGLHTQADLDRMKARVAAGERPWIDSWNALLLDPKAQSTYNPAPQANMGANRQRAAADAVAAYLNAIRGYVADSTEHTDNAIRICNLWSAAVNQPPSGTDQPGLNGIFSYQFAVVGEILRIHVGTRWAQADFDRFKAMCSTYLYPVCHDFLAHHRGTCISHYWANWDACNVAALAAIGVLCDDEAIFAEGVDYFKNGDGSGSIKNAVFALHPGGPEQPYGLGQWQETGRDQEHNALGVGLLAAACQIAWNQGVDLFAYDNHRLLAGAEYVAGNTLWLEMPYAPYDNCDDVNQYWSSNAERGKLQRPVWEQLYNHYVVRLGLSAPNVAALAALNRPEAFTHDDHFGYGTLAFTLDAGVSGFPAAAPAAPDGLAFEAGVGRVDLRWDPVPSANGYVVRRATVSGGPYTAIASYRGTSPRFYDSTVTNGTTYHYRIAATNQAGTGTDSIEVSATPLAASVVLPDGWARRDIGSFSASGLATHGTPAGGTFHVGASGAGIGGAADGMGYAFATVEGDAVITARVIGAALGGVGGGGRFGLMFRESLAPDATTQTLVVGNAGFREARFGTRATTGGTMTFINGNAYSGPSATVPTWFRLVREGDTFMALQSGDGTTWHVVGATTAAMASQVHVGFAAASASASVITGQFDHVTLDGVILPAPPAGLAAVNGHGQVGLSWSAAAGATGYDIKRATNSGGPYSVIVSGSVATSHVDTGLVDGTSYYYVVSSRQGGYESVDSEEAPGTPGDISSVWSAAPASGNWDAGGNWLSGAVPQDGDSLAFGATSIAALTNDLAGLAINRLTFSPGAPAYTMTGNTISVAGDIANHSSSAQVVSLPLMLAASPTIDVRSGPLTLGGLISEGVAGLGIVKAGTQSLALTAQNTFSGDVRLAAGTLSIAGVGTGTAGSPASGALGRGTVRLAGGTLTSSAAATIFNDVVVEAGTTTNIASSTANITFAGNISGGGAINESGANVGGTHFNGNNAGFTGTFTSSNATGHRIRFNSPHAGSAAATWVLNNSQTDGNGLNFGTGTIHFGALSGGGQFRNDSALNTTATLSIGALNTNTTYTGVMVANGTRFIGVTKVGTGTLTFTGNHTFTGPTSVAGGALHVNGAFASPVTVVGGTFGGRGSSTAALTVSAGGTLAPGVQGVGTFSTTAALSLAAGATCALELDSGAGTADRIVAGSVSLGGATLGITDLGTASLAVGTVLTIVDNTGTAAVAGTFAGLPENTVFPVGANLVRISYAGGSGNDVVLTISPPPPVITSALAAVAGVGMPFTYTITATNEPAGFSATGLPAGLAIDEVSGVISGTPAVAGVFTIGLGATNAGGAGAASLALSIAKAPAAVTLSGLHHTYDGSAKAVVASTEPSGLDVQITYAGSTSAPVSAGEYAVVATVVDPTHAGSATGTLVIDRATASVMLTGLTQRYDGTPRVVTAATLPAGLEVGITYDGEPDAPVYPDVYGVLATVDDANYVGSTADTLAITITARVRHMTSLHGGLDGSVQVVAAESITLNGSAWVSGDLLVAGTPAVRSAGGAIYAGTLDGPESALPDSHVVTLNSGSALRHVVRRIDPRSLPVVGAPSQPAGTRSVSINRPGQAPGDFATLRNLTLNSHAGLVAVPPGSYGSLVANQGSGFVLGIAGASEPAIYDLQNLTLNGGSRLEIVGPVILTLNTGPSINSRVTTTAHPWEWLMVRIASGGLSLNGSVELPAIVIAPNGTITLNGGSVLSGEVFADRLIVNREALLRDPMSP